MYATEGGISIAYILNLLYVHTRAHTLSHSHSHTLHTHSLPPLHPYTPSPSHHLINTLQSDEQITTAYGYLFRGDKLVHIRFVSLMQKTTLDLKLFLHKFIRQVSYCTVKIVQFREKALYEVIISY